MTFSWKRQAMTWYLTIRGDSHYSVTTDTQLLVKYLCSFPELITTGQMEFRNAGGSPWVSFVLASATESGSYAVTGEFHTRINVVDMACSYHDCNEAWYESIAARIASFLEWEAIEEHTGRRVYPSE
jgi:hypothetical protein